MAREVTCIKTGAADEYDDCRAVTKVGFVDSLTGRRRLKSPADLYDDIVNGGEQYYITLTSGQKAQLFAVNGEEKRYVRTDRERDAADDKLLKQPEC